MTLSVSCFENGGVEISGEHRKFRFPNGGSLTLPKTPSDFRWAENRRMHYSYFLFPDWIKDCGLHCCESVGHARLVKPQAVCLRLTAGEGRTK